MHELDTLTAAISYYNDILDEADAIAAVHGYTHSSTDPEAEIAARLPLMLASFSAEARAMIREHIDAETAIADALREMFGTTPHLRLVSPA